MLITPLFTLIGVLKSKDRNYIKWMLVIFAMIYASTFDMESIGDGSRHWQRVYDYYVELSFPQFWSDLNDIIFFRTNDSVNEDVYIHLLSYFVGGILGLPQLFFIFVGFVYGYFFASCMVNVFQRFPSVRQHFPYFIIAVYFIAILNLQSMNTVRTWTGFWVLFYAVLRYYDTKRLKYLLLLFSAPLFHLGYFVMALPVWVVVFLPLKRYWIILVYLASFSFSFITPGTIIKQLQVLEVGQEKIDGYYVEEKATIESKIAVYSKSSWYKQYVKSGITNWAVVMVVLVFILNGDYLKAMNSKEALLFSAGLMCKVLSNVTWFLFALTNRSGIIADLFVLAGIFLYWQRLYMSNRKLNISPIFKFVLYLGVLLIIPVFFYYVSNNLEYLSVYMLFLPEAAWFGEEVKITIRELIGLLLGF